MDFEPQCMIFSIGIQKKEVTQRKENSKRINAKNDNH